MKEPYNFRISESQCPGRGQKFQEILDKKGSRASFVLRELVDAYIRSGGKIDFPVRLVPEKE